MKTLTTLTAAFLLAATAHAGEAAVVDASAAQALGGTWTFTVTIVHADEGWDHYANAFTIETEDGRELGRRVLHHPHVDEQPFTRRLTGVRLPDTQKTVLVRAHDSVHGAGEAARVALTR